MDDRTLLELAAKAANIRGRWNREVACIRVLPGRKTPYGMTYNYWDPLADDGAALRLAVELKLEIGFGVINEVYAFKRTSGTAGLAQSLDDDPDAATRRAIVRAAAEIGKSRVSAPGAVEGE
jgi:hypothetical protein